MTKLVAKRLALKLWRYLRDHPEVQSKYEVPAIGKRVFSLRGGCPLCEVYNTDKGSSCSDGCPLYNNDGGCMEDNAPYNRWRNATTEEQRAKAADDLVKQIEAWKIGGTK